MPLIGSCKTCRFWSRVTEPQGVDGRKEPWMPEEPTGICGGVASEWEWRITNEEPVPGEAIMIDSNAQLLTNESFGCAAHERDPDA